MLIKNEQSINIDIRNMHQVPTVTFIQNDNNILLINVYENNSLADMSSVGNVMINFKRSDGVIFTQTVDWEGSVVTYKPSINDMAVSGIGEAEIQFYDKTVITNKISTRKFKVNFIGSIGIGDAGITEENPDVAFLQELINQVSAVQNDWLIDGGSFLDTYSSLPTSTDGGTF